jgi:CubicO group peptidase (beta-lactamase class C family)
MTASRHRARYDPAYECNVVFALGFQRMIWPWWGRYPSFRSFGHEGYLSTLAFADPSHQVVVAYLPNSLAERADRRWRQVVDAVYEDLGLAVHPYLRALASGEAVPYYVGPKVLEDVIDDG